MRVGACRPRTSVADIVSVSAWGGRREANNGCAQWGADSGVSASPGADGVAPEIVINSDFVHRFQACSAASDAIWQYGWLACLTDGERGSWIEHYAGYLEDRLEG
jgi:hypothetical protein